MNSFAQPEEAPTGGAEPARKPRADPGSRGRSSAHDQVGSAKCQNLINV